MDVDLQVKALNALSAAAPRLKGKDDAVSAKATKIIKDFSEMTSAELAEYIARLVQELEVEQ